MRRNNKETASYVQGLRSFNKLLPKTIKNILKKSGYNYLEIINNWDKLMGIDIAKVCYPKSIRKGPGSLNNTLTLTVKRGNEILIEYSKKKIIEKINSYFGYSFIDKIYLKSENSEAKKKKINNSLIRFSSKFEKEIKQIKNQKVKESFDKLIIVIKNG